MIILEYIIKLKGMKKKDVAAIAEVYPQVLNDWLRQRRPIPKDKLLKLSDYFNIPMEYFEKEANAQNQIAVESLLNKNEKVEQPSRYNDAVSLIVDDLEKSLRVGNATSPDKLLEILIKLTCLQEDANKMSVIENLLFMLSITDTSWGKNIKEIDDEFQKDLFIVLKKHGVI